MKLFSSIFKGSNHEGKLKIDWIPLTEKNQIDAIIELSKTKPVLIFKHSTRCGVSSMALRRFEENYDLEAKQLDLYFLDLLNFRALSNEIAIKFQVPHQSPQVIVIQKGKIIYHDSHYQINVEKMKKVLSFQPIVS